MAILTPLSLDEARRLGRDYGLDVVALRGILAGSVNSNYELGLAGGGRVFLRVYEEQGAADAAGEARLLAHLGAAGVPTPRPLPLREGVEGGTEGGFVGRHRGKPVAVFPWVEGEMLCQEGVTPEAARKVGEALARVHLAGASFGAAPASRFGLTELEERLRGLGGLELGPELGGVVERLGRRLEALAAEARSLGRGAETVIHGDLFRDNVLWQGGDIAALLDFESASRGSAAFDLAVTMLAWCFGAALDPELAGALGQGYTRLRALAADERARLFHEASLAALRFAITRITDFELRPRGSGVYKDYRRFLARGDALDRLGPEGLTALLRI